MAGNMQKCLICGKEYEVCRFCPTTIKQTPWRRLCDTPNHFQLYMMLKDVRAGILTDDEVKERLEHLKIDINEVRGMVQSVQDTLLPILEAPVESEEQPQIKKKSKKNDK